MLCDAASYGTSIASGQSPMLHTELQGNASAQSGSGRTKLHAGSGLLEQARAVPLLAMTDHRQLGDLALTLGLANPRAARAGGRRGRRAAVLAVRVALGRGGGALRACAGARRLPRLRLDLLCRATVGQAVLLLLRRRPTSAWDAMLHMLLTQEWRDALRALRRARCRHAAHCASACCPPRFCLDALGGAVVRQAVLFLLRGLLHC